MRENNDLYLITIYDKQAKSVGLGPVSKKEYTVYGNQILDHIDKLKKDNELFAVHLVAECLLDWS